MRQLRSGEPDALFEVTSRTIRGQMRMVPTPKAVDIIVGVIGEAKAKYDVKIYGLVFLSNHYHMLLGASDARHLADFMGYINGNITRELNRLHKVSGPMWHTRYRAIHVSKRVGAARMRMRYILSHGVKERLVARVRQWPGVSSARWLLDGDELVGTWTDRTAKYRAGRTRKKTKPEQFETRHKLVLDVLPEWSGKTVDEQRAHWATIVAEIEQEHAGDRAPEGVAAVLAVDPMTYPKSVKKSEAPWVHTDDDDDRQQWEETLRLLRDSHREASKAFRAGDWSVAFPEGMFRPGGGFVARHAPEQGGGAETGTEPALAQRAAA